MPLISIIVPVYNAEKYIEKCARSLFEQTLEDIEYIFVDDCSSDKSFLLLNKVLKEYPRRKAHTIIISQKTNKGSSEARNIGMNVAQGEYLAFCDADDWMADNMYEELYKKAIGTSADLVFCDFFFVFRNTQEKYNLILRTDNKENLLNDYIVTKWNVVWNLIVKKNVVLGNRLQFPSDIIYCEDFYFVTKLLYFASKVEKVDKGLYYYNQCNNASVMHIHHQYGVDDLKCYLDLISFFVSKNTLGCYDKVMSWRIQNAVCHDIYNQSRYRMLFTSYPSFKNYVFYNPFITIKQKMILFLFSHCSKKWIWKLVDLLRKIKIYIIKWRRFFLSQL